MYYTKIRKISALILSIVLIFSTLTVYVHADDWNKTMALKNDLSLNSDYFVFDGPTSGWVMQFDMYAGSITTYDSTAFFFKGTGVRIISGVNTFDDAGTLKTGVNNNVTITIDDGDVDNLELLRDTAVADCISVYEKTGLTDTVHKAVICVESPDPAICTGGWFYLNSVDVKEGNVLPISTTMGLVSDGQNISVNRSKFTFSAGWDNFYSVYAGTRNEGETASFCFNGTGFSLFAGTGTSGTVGALSTAVNDNVTISIDDGAPMPLKLLKDVPCAAPVDVYSVSGLSANSLHKAVITTGKPTAGVCTDAQFLIRSVNVIGGSVVDSASSDWSIAYPGKDGNGLNSDYFEYFGGSWRNLNPGAGSEAYSAGDSVKFEFSGNALKIFAGCNTQGEGEARISYHNDNVTISIDGGAAEQLETFREKEGPGVYCVYEKFGLSAGKHRAVITVGTPTAKATGTSFYFEKAEIYNGQVTPVPTWNTTNAVKNDFSLNTEYFEYFGNWRNLSGTDTHAEVFIPGETASFRFNGTGLRVYAGLNVQNIEGVWKTYNNNNVLISIDGGDFVQMDVLKDHYIVGDELIYEVLDLAEGAHTATIKLGASDPSVALGNSFYLAGVSVCNGNVLKVGTWNTTNAVKNDFSLNTEYFEYFGNWRNLSGTDTHAEVFIPGETASFRFNGTGLRVYAGLNVQNIEGVWKTYNNNNVLISIDGSDFVQMDVLKDHYIVGDELIYEVLDLAEGAHTATIKLGVSDPSVALGNSFYLAGVSVCDGNVLKVGTWTDYDTIYMGAKNTTYFDFDGDWRIMPFSPYAAEAYIPGSSATVKFNGTGLRLRFNLNVQMQNDKLVSFHSDKITVAIDGGTPVEVDLWRNEHTVADNQIVYDIRTLSEGEHTAVITLKEATELAVSQSIYFAGISVLDGTAVPSVEWSDRYDTVVSEAANTNIRFVGNAWGVSGTVMCAGNSGNTAKLSFNGTGLRIIAGVNVQNGQSYVDDKVSVSIDGGTPVDCNMWCYIAPGEAIVYEITGLESGNHTAVISVDQKSGDTVLSEQFYFAGVQIADGTLLNATIYGDADGNGVCNELDLILFAKYHLEIITEDELEFDLMDLDSNGKVDALDLIVLAKYNLEIINVLPYTE